MAIRIKGVLSRLHYAYIGVNEAMSSPDITSYQRDRLRKAQDIINDVLNDVEDDLGYVYDRPKATKKRIVRRK